MTHKEILVAFGRKLMRFTEEAKEIAVRARIENPWFNDAAIETAAKQWGEALIESDVERWIGNYELKPVHKKVGIIMAGNIPWVGLHDLLSVLIQSKSNPGWATPVF